jgi:hypothetical protein
MKNYQITIGYKAVVCVNVKATDEKEAKDIAIKKFSKKKDKIYGSGIELQDDNFKADGILDMDATWGMYDK